MPYVGSEEFYEDYEAALQEVNDANWRNLFLQEDYHTGDRVADKGT